MPAALEAELKNCHIFAGSLLDLASLITKDILVSQIRNGEAGQKTRSPPPTRP